MDQTTLIEIVLQKRKQGSCIIAIEGLCGSGKSTLAKQLQTLCGGVLIHMDDFCLPISKRTTGIAGHMDLKRLKEEIIIPWKQQSTLNYHKFDCKNQQYIQCETNYQPILIIEGSYCMHPDLEEDYDICCFVETKEEQRMKHLIQREKDNIQTFLEIWQQKELEYHKYYQIKEKCDYIISK